MRSALAYQEPNCPENWYELPMGEVIESAINETISHWTPKFFGYHLLKLGALSGQIDCHLSPIKHQVTVAHCRDKSSVIGDIDDLPFVGHSIDVCILGHALEFSIDPHHVLREANRVLIPNGYLVITGYNPFSFVSLNKLVPYRRSQTPWKEHFFAPMRVKDWLELMGFEILEDKRLLHSTLAGNVKQNEIGKFKKLWQKLAMDYLPSMGSIYFIVAKKRVHPLTPIRPILRLRTHLNPTRLPSMHSNKIKHK